MFRGQVDIFNDETGCTLEFTNYHEVAKALGCEGFQIDHEDQIGSVMQQAKVRHLEMSSRIDLRLGLTIFFVASRCPGQIGAHQRQDWQDRVQEGLDVVLKHQPPFAYR